MMKLVGKGFFINLNDVSFFMKCFSLVTIHVIFYRRKHCLDSSFHFWRIYLHRLGYSCSRSSGRKTCIVNIIFSLVYSFISIKFIGICFNFCCLGYASTFVAFFNFVLIVTIKLHVHYNPLDVLIHV